MTFFVTLSKALVIPHKNHFYIMASTSIAILSLCVILARWARLWISRKEQVGIQGKGPSQPCREVETCRECPGKLRSPPALSRGDCESRVRGWLMK